MLRPLTNAKPPQFVAGDGLEYSDDRHELAADGFSDYPMQCGSWLIWQSSRHSGATRQEPLAMTLIGPGIKSHCLFWRFGTTNSVSVCDCLAKTGSNNVIDRWAPLLVSFSILAAWAEETIRLAGRTERIFHAGDLPVKSRLRSAAGQLRAFLSGTAGRTVRGGGNQWLPGSAPPKVKPVP